jgi:PqqD family protein of HPr-rel-A system
LTVLPSEEKQKTTSLNADTQRWRLLGEEPPRYRNWDGDYVIFNSFSGQTHYLDIVTGRVFERLMLGPSSREELRCEIADFLDLEDDHQVANMISRILGELEEVGLIEPTD